MDKELEELLQTLTLEELVGLNELLPKETIQKIIKILEKENKHDKRIRNAK